MGESSLKSHIDHWLLRRLFRTSSCLSNPCRRGGEVKADMSPWKKYRVFECFKFLITVQDKYRQFFPTTTTTTAHHHPLQGICHCERMLLLLVQLVQRFQYLHSHIYDEKGCHVVNGKFHVNILQQQQQLDRSYREETITREQKTQNQFFHAHGPWRLSPCTIHRTSLIMSASSYQLVEYLAMRRMS